MFAFFFTFVSHEFSVSCFYVFCFYGNDANVTPTSVLIKMNIYIHNLSTKSIGVITLKQPSSSQSSCGGHTHSH